MLGITAQPTNYTDKTIATGNVNEAPMTELSTREIYLDACKKIASKIEPYGFQFIKTGPKLKKVTGDYTYEIDFKSSYGNIAGHWILIDIWVWVKSKKIKAWRKTQPEYKKFPVSGKNDIAAEDLQSTAPNPHYHTWNLANPDTRLDIINEISNLIITHALVFFDRYSDPNNVKNELMTTQLFPLRIREPDRFIEYALCYLTAESAKEISLSHLGNFVRRHQWDDFSKSYNEAFECYSTSKEDLADRPTGQAQIMAFYSVKCGWGNLVSSIT